MQHEKLQLIPIGITVWLHNLKSLTIWVHLELDHAWFQAPNKEVKDKQDWEEAYKCAQAFPVSNQFSRLSYLTLNSLKGTLLSSKIGKSTTIQEKTTFSSIYPVSCKELNSQRKVHWYISDLADMMDIGMASEIWLGLSSKSQVSIFLRKSLTRSTTTSSLNPCLSHLQLV